MARITRSRGAGLALGLAVLGCLAAVCVAPSGAQDIPAKVKDAEAKRVAAVEKVRPSVVAVFGPGGQGGGSGVLISEDGYALTNFHVTKTNPTMKCGLPDGVLYDAVLVGLDKVGDVALIKLLPKKDGQKFPFAPLGDSDKLKPGDWSLAMGNPFLLATDFTPTVTFGLISGTHRYQEPAPNWLLEYTDCIQIDTSINPGNSGGPLFNMQGELVGINGRGSFDKRTRINSGVGYAISINQIKNFMGHLRAGMDADHASLGAEVYSEGGEDGNLPKMLIRGVLEVSDVAKRKMEPGDQLVAFGGRPMSTVNQYKNCLGLFPRGWRVPLTYRRDEEKAEVLVRLMGVQKQAIEEENKGNPMPPNPRPQPRPQPGPQPGPAKPSPAQKFFEAKQGFANHYFNKQERNRLWADFTKKCGEFGEFKGEFGIKAEGDADGRQTNFTATVKDDGVKPAASVSVIGLDYSLEPLEAKTTKQDMSNPPKSGGLITALYLYRQLLVGGEKGFVGEFSHGGHEPWYLPAPVGAKPNYEVQKVMCEVIRTRHAGTSAKWYFSLKDHRLIGFEVSIDSDDDPCEVYLLDYKPVDGKELPTRMVVRHGEDTYADLGKVTFKFNK